MIDEKFGDSKKTLSYVSESLRRLADKIEIQAESVDPKEIEKFWQTLQDAVHQLKNVQYWASK